MNRLEISLLFFLLLGLAACDKATPDHEFVDCEYLAPEAIFAADTKGLSGHRFTLDEQKGVETFNLVTGTTVTIVQTGCHSRQQDFSFRLRDRLEENTRDPEFWVAQVIEQLNLFSQLGPEYIVFRHWAKAISKKASQIQVGDTYELQDGFYVKIDHQQQKDHTVLLLTISDQL